MIKLNITVIWSSQVTKFACALTQTQVIESEGGEEQSDIRYLGNDGTNNWYKSEALLEIVILPKKLRRNNEVSLDNSSCAERYRTSPAGPWQIVAFFYAYRISINAFGVEKNIIASKNRGSIADGSCTLDEFVEFTRKSKKDGIPLLRVLIGDYLTPDPLITVKMIKNSAYDAG
ncbi:hypothetical protein EAE99_003746 [Botrytis elliptica]|nr:hypothetical protein EAE99_003746 [Botrytis elliptica]